MTDSSATALRGARDTNAQGSSGGSRWALLAGVALLVVSLVLKLAWVRHELVSPGAIRAVGMGSDLAFIGLVVALVAMTRRPLWWGLLADAVISVGLFGTLVYVAYFNQLPTLELLGLSRQLGDVDASILSLVQPQMLLVFADLIPLAVLAVLAGRAPARGRAMRLALGTVALACGVAFAASSYGIVSAPGAIDSLEASRQRGLFAWTVGSMLRPEEATAVYADPAEVASVQKQIDGLLGVQAERISSAPAPGAAAGSNVIAVQFEALQSGIVGKRIAGRSVTPNLDRLIGQSWYFPNTVSQAGKGMTADAEFVVATSMYPPAGDPASVSMADRQLPSLPRTLEAEGYRTTTMHANRVAFWNRTQLYPAIGFGSYYDVKLYGRDDVVGMGESDEGFYATSLPVLQKMHAAQAPFFAQMISLSSHHPFRELPASKHAMEVTPELRGTLAGRYVQNIAYADRALGAFLRDLEREGVLEDTVVVVYGDHFALGPADARDPDNHAQELFGSQYNAADQVRIPLIVHLPRQTQAHRSEQLLQQTDIAPTLSDLLGVSMAERPVFGASAFRTRDDYVAVTSCLVPRGSFVTDAGVLRIGMGLDGAKVYKTGGGVRAAGEQDVAEFERAQKLMSMSDAFAKGLPKRSGVGEVGKGAKLPPAGERALEGSGQ